MIPAQAHGVIAGQVRAWLRDGVSDPELLVRKAREESLRHGVSRDEADLREIVDRVLANGSRVTDEELDDEPSTGGTNDDDVTADLVYASEAKPNPDPAAPYLIDRLLRRRQFHVLAAPEGLGKTRLRVELGMRLAVGHGAFVGHYRVLGEAKVLVFDEDQGPDMETEVEEQVVHGLGLTRADLGKNYARYSLLGLDLTSDDDQQRLVERVMAFAPDLVVLDTGTSMVGDEWGSALKEVVRFLLRLTQECDCAVLVLVHMVKPSRDGRSRSGNRSLDEVMGHWSKHATGVWVMSGASGDDRANFATYKRLPKTRLVLGQKNNVWEIVADQTGKPPAGIVLRTGSSDDRILRAIADGLDLTEEVTGVKDRAMYKAIDRLREKGLLTEEYPYVVTEAGYEAVGGDAQEEPA